MSQILLVRHGQASFGSDDYDNLSEVGERQSRVLGKALADRGVRADRIVVGDMRRHAQTAAGVIEGAGWAQEPTADAGWNEFDHLQVLAVHATPQTTEGEDEKRAFQRWFEEATSRWTSGDHDADYDEPFSTFTSRVEEALQRLRDELPPRGTAVVLTSGGPVAWAAATLLGQGTDVWLRLNPVCVNTGVTKVVVGSRGASLVTFNDHSHLPHDLLTYR